MSSKKEKTKEEERKPGVAKRERKSTGRVLGTDIYDYIKGRSASGE